VWIYLENHSEKIFKEVAKSCEDLYSGELHNSYCSVMRYESDQISGDDIGEL
jgi:hypothetical protein